MQDLTEIHIHLEFARAQRFQQKMMQLSGGARMALGAMLFDLVREMILASFPQDLSPDELRRRMYGEPLPADFPKQ
jgi:hypothetical protein